MSEKKRIAVAGATGRLGRHVTEVLGERGHAVVPIARGAGVDLISGAGLPEALEGVEVIVDAANSDSAEQAAATEFFLTAAGNLQRVGAVRGVAEVIVVSIIGVDHFDGGYNAAKLAHERAHLDRIIPTRVLRAAQFHEFVEQLVEWGTDGDVATVHDMRVRPVAARAVAEAVADLVDGSDAAPPGRPIAEVAGPREESLLDAASVLVALRGNGLRVEAGEFFPDPEGIYPIGAALPGPLARLAGPNYEEWLGGSN
jgi:uncharacterized protein YbjT (DUF2867 family)